MTGAFTIQGLVARVKSNDSNQQLKMALLSLVINSQCLGISMDENQYLVSSDVRLISTFSFIRNQR